MLRTIQVRNGAGALRANLPVYQSNQASALWVKDISGLGPVAANVAITSYPTGLGGVVQRTSLGDRNIVMRLGMRPNYEAGSNDYSDLRRLAYRYLSPMSVVNLFFQVGLNDFYNIEGVVESNEPSIFTKEPEMVVSIRCADPFFKAPNPTVISMSTGTPVSSDQFGTGDSGFKLNLLADRSISQVILRNGLQPDIVFYVGVSQPLGNGDELEISTVFGSKMARIRRNGTSLFTPALHNITSGSLDMVVSSNVSQFEVITGSSGTPFLMELMRNYVGM